MINDGDELGMVKMTGFDDCIEGICVRFGQEPIIIYDLEKVLKKLMADGMTREEAEEFWGFNQVGAWWGPTTPAFLDRNVEAYEL